MCVFVNVSVNLRACVFTAALAWGHRHFLCAERINTNTVEVEYIILSSVLFYRETVIEKISLADFTII